MNQQTLTGKPQRTSTINVENMKYIELTRGARTIVDDETFDFLNEYKWHLKKSNDRIGYAARNAAPYPVRALVFLHHMLMPRIKGYEIDHINRNSLDNRRENLRYATASQNQYNKDTYTKKRRTHCKKGHELTPENIYKPNECKTCVKASCRAYYLKHKKQRS